jgi:hypothetical protein
MTNQFNTLMIITVIIASGLTHNANGMMGRYLLTLAGDACLLASAGAMLTKEMRPEDEKTFLELGKPSQLSQIRADAQKVLPYAPLLIPGGTVLSVGGRLGIIAKGSGAMGKAGGLLLAGVSVPTNAALVTSAYLIKMEQVPGNADLINKTKDKLHEISKNK